MFLNNFEKDFVIAHEILNRKHEMFLNELIDKETEKLNNLTVNMKCF